MSNQKFKRDFKQGQKYEKLATLYFDFDRVSFSQGYCKEYDFWYEKDGIKKYVEVKSDRWAGKTGNLCIEYEYRGSPSGIEASKADYWLYFILNTNDGDLYGKVQSIEAYKIPSDKLRDIVKGCRKVVGGDGKRSKLYLVNKGLVSQYRVFRNKKNSIKKDTKTDDLSKSMEKVAISSNKS
jgi:hypothetical protein